MHLSKPRAKVQGGGGPFERCARASINLFDLINDKEKKMITVFTESVALAIITFSVDRLRLEFKCSYYLRASTVAILQQKYLQIG